MVDNGSGPRRRACWQTSARAGGWPCARSRHEVTLGPAGGRNAGWRLARAPLVAFTDDDCAPGPGLARGHLAVAREHPGARAPGPDPARPGRARRRSACSRTRCRIERLGPQYRDLQHRLPAGGARGAGRLRRALRARARRRGHRPRLARDRVGVRDGVRPRRGRPPRRASGSACAGCCGCGALERGHAGVRRHPGDAVDALPPAVLERVALPAVALAAGAGRARPGCGACCWRATCALALRARASRARARSAVPFLIAYDAVECWSVARGAIRHRTLVL